MATVTTRIPRRAILCGMNYPTNPALQLFGCVDDMWQYYGLLTRVFQFHPNEIALISDVLDVPEAYSLDNVSVIKMGAKTLLDNIKSMVDFANTTAGTTNGPVQLVFTYAGHGAQVKDKSNDEEDGMDEFIVLDAYMTDDVISQALLARLDSRVSVFAVFDCCHSGSILDLQYTYDANAGTTFSSKQKPVAASVTMISGCRDAQTSAEHNSYANGVATLSLLGACAQFIGGTGKFREVSPGLCMLNLPSVPEPAPELVERVSQGHQRATTTNISPLTQDRFESFVQPPVGDFMKTIWTNVKKGPYVQVPVLSSSRPIILTDPIRLPYGFVLKNIPSEVPSQNPPSSSTTSANTSLSSMLPTNTSTIPPPTSVLTANTSTQTTNIIPVSAPSSTISSTTVAGPVSAATTTTTTTTTPTTTTVAESTTVAVVVPAKTNPNTVSSKPTPISTSTVLPTKVVAKQPITKATSQPVAKVTKNPVTTKKVTVPIIRPTIPPSVWRASSSSTRPKRSVDVDSVVDFEPEKTLTRNRSVPRPHRNHRKQKLRQMPESEVDKVHSETTRDIQKTLTLKRSTCSCQCSQDIMHDLGSQVLACMFLALSDCTM